MSAAPNTSIVCYVTDRKSFGATRPAETGVRAGIKAAIVAGVDWVQIREKDLPARELLALVRDALQVAADSSAAVKPLAAESAVPRTAVRIIVNDRLDVALAAGAAGVHLGRESLSVKDVVEWCRRRNAPPEFLIGVSCHSVEDAREAESAGAGYIFFGPIFDTPSKRSLGQPQGIQRLAEICAGLRIPVIAIGGVDEANAQECLLAGSAGIAAIRMIQKRANERGLKNAIDRIHRHIPGSFL